MGSAPVEWESGTHFPGFPQLRSWVKPGGQGSSHSFVHLAPILAEDVLLWVGSLLIKRRKKSQVSNKVKF